MEVEEEQEEEFDEDQECTKKHDNIVNLEKPLLKKRRHLLPTNPRKW